MKTYRNPRVCYGCKNYKTVCKYDKYAYRFDDTDIPDNCIRKKEHEEVIYRNIKRCLSCSHLVHFDDKGIRQDEDYYMCDLMDAFFNHVSRWCLQVVEKKCSLYTEFLVEQLNKKKEQDK